MVVRRKGKPYGGPWYSQYSDVVKFERAAHENFPDLRCRNRRAGQKKWREYTLVMDVPDYEPRHVLIKMYPNRDATPKVTVDGPSNSPHRFHDDGGALCMWYTWDPKEKRWVFSDGLLHLLVLIQAHLFREAWWRETGGKNGGEWLGPEVEH